MEEQDKKNEHEELMALIERTDKENPNPDDLKQLRAHLNNNSALVQLNELSEQAFKRVIENFTNSALMRELLNRQVEEKREAFGYKTATIFEQMLIDQVILCHIRLNNIELTHTARLEAVGSHTHASGLYWDKRLSSAQRRFTRACEALAKVRKLLAEAELKEQQARNKRSQSAILATKILKDLTK
ncbi:MAG: hypothetical protein JSS81_23365 [Acidobacteria bacterium]|nr:hypothetical protein [Acidobacteriota bacterium]